MKVFKVGDRVRLAYPPLKDFPNKIWKVIGIEEKHSFYIIGQLEISDGATTRTVYDYQLIFENGDNPEIPCECGSRSVGHPGHAYYCETFKDQEGKKKK